MLTALAILILAVLVLIARDLNALGDQAESIRKAWICPKCHGSGVARGADDPEEQCGLCFGTGFASGEMNRWLAQILGKLDRIDDTILELWACPTCLGSGRISSLGSGREAPEECETCKGTGRRNSG